MMPAPNLDHPLFEIANFLTVGIQNLRVHAGPSTVVDPDGVLLLFFQG